MYDDHVPTICAAMRASPEVFWRGSMFAVLSIQQMIVTVPRALKEVEEKGQDSKYLFGSKFRAYHDLTDHKVELWDQVCAAQNPVEFIEPLTRMHGIGIVKAAFIAQLMGHDVACLDTRNIKREGRNPREFRSDNHGRPVPRAWIERYVHTTQGRARELWNAWCNEVAKVYGMTPETISKLHLDTIVPLDYRNVPVLPVPLYGATEEIPF